MDSNNNDIQQLISGYLTQSLNEQEYQLFLNWLQTDAKNREQFEQLKSAWELAGAKKEMQSFNSGTSWQKIKSQITENPVKLEIRTLRFLKTAALWLILIASGSFITLVAVRRTPGTSQNIITEVVAPLGAKSIISMPDGTKIWLNAGSKISYDSRFNEKERIVQLTGEAYFQVKSNKAKPFIVKTSDVIVRALGTRFNVKAYPEEKTITATLEEGKIDVQLTSNENSKRVELKPNENIVYYKTGSKVLEHSKISEPKKVEKIESLGKLEVQPEVKTILYTSWKEENWVIEREPLSSLIPKLERKFNLNIEFADSEITRYKFTGTFRNETIEQILTALSFTAPIDYTIEKNLIVLKINPQLKEKFTRIITHKN